MAGGRDQNDITETHKSIRKGRGELKGEINLFGTCSVANNKIYKWSIYYSTICICITWRIKKGIVM